MLTTNEPTTESRATSPAKPSALIKRLTKEALALEAERVAARQRGDDAVKKAEAVRDKAKAALLTAQREVDRQVRQRQTEVVPVEQKLAAVVRELTPLVGPSVWAARARMYQRFGEVRKHGMKSFERPRVDARGQAVIDVTTGRVIVDVFSNRKHIETICTAVTDADARFMALLERPVEDVDGAIAAIEASVPWSLVNDLERL